MEKAKKAWINAAFLAVTLVINTLGAVGVINGLSQKEISDMYLTLITPSPSTFRIWSIIYTFLIISIVMMIVKKDDPYYQRATEEITLFFRISCVLNAVWIISFSFVLVEISVLFIFGFAVTLALICKKLLQMQTGNRWLLPLSFGLYTGWLLIATVVNTSAALVKLQWNGFGIADEIWAVATLAIAVLLVAFIATKLQNAVVPLPVAWAYFGIYQFLSSPEGFKGVYPLLQITALVGMTVLIGLAAIRLHLNRYRLLPNPPAQ
jgi:hypothetical protein